MPGEMLNLDAKAADRARMGRLHLTKSETRFHTEQTITYFSVLRPVLTIVSL
jgi:hypothetical protein